VPVGGRDSCDTGHRTSLANSGEYRRQRWCWRNESEDPRRRSAVLRNYVTRTVASSRSVRAIHHREIGALVAPNGLLDLLTGARYFLPDRDRSTPSCLPDPSPCLALALLSCSPFSLSLPISLSRSLSRSQSSSLFSSTVESRASFIPRSLSAFRLPNREGGARPQERRC